MCWLGYLLLCWCSDSVERLVKHIVDNETYSENIYIFLSKSVASQVGLRDFSIKKKLNTSIT